MKYIYIMFPLMFYVSLVCGQESNSNRIVMSWVPPYAVNACQQTLRKSFNGEGMHNGLTHLGLQFWTPTVGGEIEQVSKYGIISDSQVEKFREWGNQHNVYVMLCVYNGTSKWDWNLASSAFATNKTTFIDSIIKETMRLDLDGVDIDLEGGGSLNLYKDDFVTFIMELSDRLHKNDKLLTVDSFTHKWNAPNSSWWPELLPFIDGLNVMGYSETGASATGWRAYASLKKAAGDFPEKLLIGMPSHKAEWQESSLEENLNWVISDPSLGLAIWDARLKDPAWRTKETWERISEISKKTRQNHQLQPTVKTPVESGSEQGTAAEL